MMQSNAWFQGVPSVFIGSSSERLPDARALKAHIQQFAGEGSIEVDVWDEDVFYTNESFLGSLRKFTDTYDFAIMLLTPDDEIISRGESAKGPRHNLVFEFGLFLGRLGAKRTFLIVEESIRSFFDKPFSDLKGVSFLSYAESAAHGPAGLHESGTVNLSKPLSAVAKTVAASILAEYKELRVSFFPSVTLAIGYFENFLSKISKSLYEAVQDEDVKAKYTIEISNEKKLFRFDSFEINVIIPNTLERASYNRLSDITSYFKLRKIGIETPSRPFYTYAFADSLKAESTHLRIADIPTTLATAGEAVSMMVDKQETQLINRINDREVLAFGNALAGLVESKLANVKSAIRILTEEALKAETAV